MSLKHPPRQLSIAELEAPDRGAPIDFGDTLSQDLDWREIG